MSSDLISKGKRVRAAVYTCLSKNVGGSDGCQTLPFCNGRAIISGPFPVAGGETKIPLLGGLFLLHQWGRNSLCVIPFINASTACRADFGVDPNAKGYFKRS